MNNNHKINTTLTKKIRDSLHVALNSEALPANNDNLLQFPYTIKT